MTCRTRLRRYKTTLGAKAFGHKGAAVSFLPSVHGPTRLLLTPLDSDLQMPMPPHGCDAPQMIRPDDALSQDLERGRLDLQHGRLLHVGWLTGGGGRDVDGDPAVVPRRGPAFGHADLFADGVPREVYGPGSVARGDDLVGDN